MMCAVILDISVTAAWVLDDEDSSYADAVYARVPGEGALVPDFWHIEIRNVLLSAERRNRIAPEEVEQRLAELAALPIQTDRNLELNTAYDLAKMHGLSFYDAVYLELALRRNVTLATLDTALIRVAAAEGLFLVA